jgi:hypothetical protein
MLSATRTRLHGWILDRSCPSGTRRIGRDKHDIQMRDLISLPNQGTQDANGSVKWSDSLEIQRFMIVEGCSLDQLHTIELDKTSIHYCIGRLRNRA